LSTEGRSGINRIIDCRRLEANNPPEHPRSGSRLARRRRGRSRELDGGVTASEGRLNGDQEAVKATGEKYLKPHPRWAGGHKVGFGRKSRVRII
jgi:hypothetical protein